MPDNRKIMMNKLRELWIPQHMHESISEYVLHGRPPGGFLNAVLENDLMESAGLADDQNRECLFQYAKLLYLLPYDSWGSPEKVQAWIKKGGLEGHESQ